MTTPCRSRSGKLAASSRVVGVHWWVESPSVAEADSGLVRASTEDSPAKASLGWHVESASCWLLGSSAEGSALDSAEDYPVGRRAPVRRTPISFSARLLCVRVELDVLVWRRPCPQAGPRVL